MKIFSIKKIPIEIHYSLILLSLVLFFIELISNGFYSTITYGSLFIVLFSSVMLHEIGHALVARKFGIPTRKIILFPLGGIAFIDSKNMTPKQEFFISIAGPLVNLLVVLLGLIITLISDSFFIYCIIIINMIMGIFNLIPAYPMDGGRVLRSGLSMFLSHKVATNISVSISLLISASLIISGILYSWISVIIIGIFLIYYNCKQLKGSFKREDDDG